LFLMKYLEEFRDPHLAAALAKQISRQADGLEPVNLMEVCGSHTMAIARYGLRQLLPANVKLISGPGCPVCVTSNEYLDHAFALARLPGVIITTFGDMMRVPGSGSSLEKERSKGSDIRIVYSTMDALLLAEKNPEKRIIFLAVGFETTAPTIAASIMQAAARKIKNYSILCAHKTMPKPMAAIAGAKRVNLQGFICPAHVSTIIGSKPYEFLARDYRLACVIAGFEPLDILEAIGMLLEQIATGSPSVQIQYSRVTKPDGNPAALQLLDEVFEAGDAVWRGIGTIPGSGLKLRKPYEQFDAQLLFDVEIEPTREASGCICGEVMQGVARPAECLLFGTECTPEDPVGACMVSSEGTCAAAYKYERLHE
jgi:hydrogenase expression/formation protein HypD